MALDSMMAATAVRALEHMQLTSFAAPSLRGRRDLEHEYGHVDADEQHGVGQYSADWRRRRRQQRHADVDEQVGRWRLQCKRGTTFSGGSNVGS